jgi:hypothetical protein
MRAAIHHETIQEDTMKLELPSRVRGLAPLALRVLLLAAAAPAAQAVTIYDNLGSAQAGADPILSYGPLAISFDTGSVAGTLSSVAALLKSDSTQLVGSLQLKLLADDGLTPGSELATFGSLSSAAISTSAFAAYDFGALAPVQLAAHTTYWIEIAAASPLAVEWSWSNDTSALGVAGQASYSQEFGVLMNSDSGPYQVAIEVAAVPEPATVALLALGLGVVGAMKARRNATHA